MSHISSSLTPIVLDDGRSLAAGELTGDDFDPETKFNARHIAAGRLLPVSAPVAELDDEQLAAFLDDSTVPQVLDTAGADDDLARRILAAEEARPEPRKGVTDALAHLKENA